MIFFSYSFDFVLLFTLTIYKISMLLSIHRYMCVRRMHLE